jgi:hypothetical protein
LFREIDDPRRRVRLIGIGVTGFGEEVIRQLAMFEGGPDDSDVRIAGALDALNDRFGRDSVTRAALLDGKQRRES